MIASAASLNWEEVTFTCDLYSNTTWNSSKIVSCLKQEGHYVFPFDKLEVKYIYNVFQFKDKKYTSSYNSSNTLST